MLSSAKAEAYNERIPAFLNVNNFAKYFYYYIIGVIKNESFFGQSSKLLSVQMLKI